MKSSLAGYISDAGVELATVTNSRGQLELTEYQVSFQGLERICSFLIESNGKLEVDWLTAATDRPSTIIEKALAGSDAIASAAMDLFIDCYASEAANLALKSMTLGGLFVGGAIAPRIVTLLEKGRFMERFVKRGKMERLLTNVPVGIIIEERTALLGAAKVALTL